MWTILSHSPRVSTCAGVISSQTCKDFIKACLPSFNKTASDPDLAHIARYQSLPLGQCGNEAMEILHQSGMIEAAASATGIRHRDGDDIMVARTRRAGKGGETYFPALGEHMDNDKVAKQLNQAYDDGLRTLAPDSAVSVACEQRFLRWRFRLMQDPDSSDSLDPPISMDDADGVHPGIGVMCTAGTALVFDTNSWSTWHAPCALTGVGDESEEKWIITFFKTPPPLWTSMMLGV